MLRPKVAILDEIDSGLDVDALDDVAAAITAAVAEWGLGVIAITHQRRLLEVLRPTAMHVFAHGRIVASGGTELIDRLEREGYTSFL